MGFAMNVDRSLHELMLLFHGCLLESQSHRYPEACTGAQIGFPCLNTLSWLEGPHEARVKDSEQNNMCGSMFVFVDVCICVCICFLAYVYVHGYARSHVSFFAWAP